jgi:serine/threonine-protein kinase HipA
MSTDNEAVIWTRLGGTPQRMGRLYITDKECRFTYDAGYLELDQPGLGLVYAPEYYGLNTISRERTEKFNLLPPLQALIPPAQDDNFQRNLALKYLATQGKNDLQGFDADWEILKVSGHGGIGHLDLFEDDDKANQWYSNPPEHQLMEITDELGFTLKEFITWFDSDVELLIQTVGPTPSVGGAIPKLLLSIPSSGWDGRIGLPTRQNTTGVTDVVLKFEQTSRYPGIIELETMALDMHRVAGFNVPRYWPCHFKGMPALAIERFDRDEQHTPVCTETLFSILASGVATMAHNHDYRYDYINKAINTSPVSLVTDALEAKEHLFKRLIMAMLTGNGDLHLENLSIINHNKTRKFTPIYDPAPMRAYSQHDMLSAMSFGDYGEYLDERDEPVKFNEAIERYSNSAGLSKNRFGELVTDLLDKTSDYESRINALSTVPDENKERLIGRIENVRKQLS